MPRPWQGDKEMLFRALNWHHHLPVCIQSCSEDLVSEHVTIYYWVSKGDLCLLTELLQESPLSSRDEPELSQCPTFPRSLDLPVAPRTRLDPCLQVDFILFSNDFILAPVLCSAFKCTFSAAQHIKLEIWCTWEKNALFPCLFFSWISFPTWCTGWTLKYFCSPEHRAALGSGTSSWGPGICFKTDQLLEPDLKMSIPASVDEAGIRGRGRGIWPAAWSRIDLVKPTSITKGKEKEETYRLLTFFSIFQENHLKRLGSWIPSNDHDLVNLWSFFYYCFVRLDKHPQACLSFPFILLDVTEEAIPLCKADLCVTIHTDQEHSEPTYSCGQRGSSWLTEFRT